MDDLISRQEAIDALGERPMVWSDDDEYALGERSQYDIDRLAIETVPSAQPEIIQCKDCVYSCSDVWLYANRPATVECYCSRTDLHIWPNDFCSKAERREEGEQNDE